MEKLNLDLGDISVSLYDGGVKAKSDTWKNSFLPHSEASNISIWALTDTNEAHEPSDKQLWMKIKLGE